MSVDDRRWSRDTTACPPALPRRSDERLPCAVIGKRGRNPVVAVDQLLDLTAGDDRI
jgi:hypothetical protein